MPLIHVTDREGTKHEISADLGRPLMEALRDANFLAAICGGVMSCATCHVYVEEAWLDRLPERSADEAELLSELFTIQDNSRLSCQIAVTAELEGLALTVAPDD